LVIQSLKTLVEKRLKAESHVNFFLVKKRRTDTSISHCVSFSLWKEIFFTYAKNCHERSTIQASRTKRNVDLSKFQYSSIHLNIETS